MHRLWKSLWIVTSVGCVSRLAERKDGNRHVTQLLCNLTPQQ
jgi:hypothetical protein